MKEKKEKTAEKKTKKKNEELEVQEEMTFT